MKDSKDRIHAGKRKIRWAIGLGLFPELIFILYDLLVDQEGYAIAFLILFVIGLLIGLAMAHGSNTARWIWVLCGFVLSVLLFLAMAIALEGSNAPIWQLLLLDAGLTFGICMFSINNRDVEAFFQTRKAEVNPGNMEDLIDEIGQ
jgi:hypothetical protein